MLVIMLVEEEKCGFTWKKKVLTIPDHMLMPVIRQKYCFILE